MAKSYYTAGRRRRAQAPSFTLKLDYDIGHCLEMSAQLPSATPSALRTGLLSLDVALGGGLPAGVSEIYGPDSSGKTAVLGQALASAQQAGLDAALISSEYLDIPYLAQLGVDLDKLYVVRPHTDALMSSDVEEFAVGFCQCPGTVLAIDSLTAHRHLFQDDAEWGFMVFKLLQILAHEVSFESWVLATSQVRTRYEKGRPTAKLKSASDKFTDLFSASIELSRAEVHEDSYTLVADIKSNTLARPGRVVELPAIKGFGVDRAKDMLQLLVAWEIATQSGPWFSVAGTSLGPGFDAAGEALMSGGLFDQLYNEVLLHVSP